MKRLAIGLLLFLLGGAAGYFLAAPQAKSDVAGPDRTREATHRSAEKRSVAEGEDEPSAEAVDASVFVIGDGVTETVCEADEPDEGSVESDDDSSDTLTEAELAEISRRRREVLDRNDAMRRGKLAFIDSIDPDFLTDEQRAVHVRYAETLALRNATKEGIRKASEAGLEAKAEDLGVLHDCEGKLTSLSDAERRILLEAAVRSVGLEGEAVRDFLEILKSIESSTTDLKD